MMKLTNRFDRSKADRSRDVLGTEHKKHRDEEHKSSSKHGHSWENALSGSSKTTGTKPKPEDAVNLDNLPYSEVIKHDRVCIVDQHVQNTIDCSATNTNIKTKTEKAESHTKQSNN